MAKKKLANLREDYSKKELDISDVLDNPLKQFETWIKEALQSKVPEPNAMTLSTVSPDGIPSARIVLLKKLSEKGFTFFTNYNSQKGKEMAKNKNVSLTFVWLELERQVRIEGVVKKVSKKAWVSSQSKVIKNREVLEKSMKDLEERFKDEEVLPCPPNWGGYLVQPVLIEFWQGRRSRLHDRIRYKLTKKGKWKKERLAP